MNKVFIVAKFEYLRTVKRAGFWLSTLFFPVFIIVIMAIQAYSIGQSEEAFNRISAEIDRIYLIDEGGFVDDALIKTPLVKSNDLSKAIAEMETGEADGIIYFSSNLIQEKSFKVYAPESNLLGGTSYSALANSLLKQSAYTDIANEEIVTIITTEFSGQTIYIDKSGEQTVLGLEKFILPVISFVLFFFAVFISAQYLLQSVSEEKENRMIESILSMINSRKLIYGKIIGLSAVVLTQLMIWAGAAGGLLVVANAQGIFPIAINFAEVDFSLLPVNIFFTLAGFLLFSAIMTGVGAVATSYKDAQSLSSVFIMLSILPIYFVTIILAEPNGTIAQIVSIFPLTSPMIFLVRNSLGALTTGDVLLGIFLNIFYVYIAFLLAGKMFDLGSLLYNRRPSVKEIWYTIKR